MICELALSCWISISVEGLIEPHLLPKRGSQMNVAEWALTQWVGEGVEIEPFCGSSFLALGMGLPDFGTIHEFESRS